MKYDKNSASKPVLGLNKDIHPSEQPKETVRFALNAIKEDVTGNFNNYQSEPSNELCYELPSGYKTIGSIYLEDGEKVIFVTNNTTSKIILLDGYCKTTELVSNTCLGFSTKHTITGEYRVREGCNRVIYYCDNFNPDRFLDLDDLNSFKNSSGDWDCNLMRLTPEFKIPQVTINSVNNSGGNLKIGSYAFAVELLDNNLNSIDYGVFSNYIPIYNDNISDTYSSIRGNLPAPQFNSNVGGVEITNKSISLTLNNLDTSFSFARVIVFYRGSDNSTLETAYKLEDFIPISQQSINYEFTDVAGATLDDATKYKVPKQKYFSTDVMEQVQNRLVRANVKEDVRDYSQYQRIANNITVSYGVTIEDPNDITEAHNTKNPLSYQNGNTWIGDEIYALGIEYIFNDGTISPVFHIPGRAPTDTDLQTFTVKSFASQPTDIPAADAAHLGLLLGDTIARWKYENTAELPSQTNPKPKLGYYETNTTYPQDLDCTGLPIYGDLAGKAIRHHRIPCRSDIPTYYIDSNNNIKVQKIYLNFDNIEYPDPDIVAHRLVKAKRTDRDKTVVDSGLLFNDSIVLGEDIPDTEENYVFSKFFNGTPYRNTTIKGIVSPRILAGEDLSFDYIKYHKALGAINININQDTRSDITVTTTELDFVFPTQYDFRGTYRDVQAQKLISPNSIFNGNFNKPVVNLSRSNTIVAVELNSDSPLVDGIPAGGFFVTTISLKKDNQPYRNLFQLQYEPIGQIDITEHYGSSFINKFDIYNISTSVGNTSQVNYLDNIYIETDINYELRVEGSDCNTVYSRNKDLMDYSFDKITNLVGGERVLSDICSEYYRYNNDYTPLNTNVSIPIPFNFDYCDECLAHRPNRIIFSPQSFNEETSDFYRVNFTDDYIDLPYHRGAITGIKYKNNKLYIHTEQTTFILQPNPQFVSTDQNTAYLNTGDFLSIPPYEIMQTDLGYGGLQNKLATSNSEYGYVWFDSITGKVLSLTNGINNLSNTGMLQWFKENSRSKLNEFIKEQTGKSYPFKDSINDNNGVGVSMIYDPRFERVIINKKDYLPTGKFKSTITNDTNVSNLETGKLYYNTDTNTFVVNYNGTLRNIRFDNESFFYNVGWNISYSFKNQAFISYHSYLTDIMFNDETYFYTVKNNKIYQHLHKDKYTNYFDTQYPFIIEYVANDFATDITKSVQYYATFTDKETDINTNYNNLLAYNSKQSTGKLNLLNIDQHTNPYATLINDPSIKSVITTDLNSKINNLWDYSTSSAVISKEAIDLESEVLLNGYIDLVPINIDYTKSPYTAGELRDKYLIVRLFYYPNKGTEKVTHRLSNTVELVSVR